MSKKTSTEEQIAAARAELAIAQDDAAKATEAQAFVRGAAADAEAAYTATPTDAVWARVAAARIQVDRAALDVRAAEAHVAAAREALAAAETQGRHDELPRLCRELSRPAAVAEIERLERDRVAMLERHKAELVALDAAAAAVVAGFNAKRDRIVELVTEFGGDAPPAALHANAVKAQRLALLWDPDPKAHGKNHAILFEVAQLLGQGAHADTRRFPEGEQVVALLHGTFRARRLEVDAAIAAERAANDARVLRAEKERRVQAVERKHGREEAQREAERLGVPYGTPSGAAA